MIKISGKYIGGLNVELVHEDSGAKIRTSAPKDNNGDGDKFSPTDLVAGALGSCMLTVYAIFAERDGVNLDGATVNIEKHMQSNPRRISPINVSLHFPTSIPEDKREKYEKAAYGCPVHKSLSEDISYDISFCYDL